MEPDIHRRITLANEAYYSLDSEIDRATKMRMYKIIVRGQPSRPGP